MRDSEVPEAAVQRMKRRHFALRIPFEAKEASILIETAGAVAAFTAT